MLAVMMSRPILRRCHVHNGTASLFGNACTVGDVCGRWRLNANRLSVLRGREISSLSTISGVTVTSFISLTYIHPTVNRQWFALRKDWCQIRKRRSAAQCKTFRRVSVPRVNTTRSHGSVQIPVPCRGWWLAAAISFGRSAGTFVRKIFRIWRRCSFIQIWDGFD